MFITMDSLHTIDTYIPKESMNVVDYLGLFTLGPSYTLVYWVMALKGMTFLRAFVNREKFFR